MASKDQEARERAAAAFRAHPRAEVHATIAGTSASGKTEKDIEIHAQDDFVTLNTHGEARLDRESLITLQKRLQQAFQVVA